MKAILPVRLHYRTIGRLKLSALAPTTAILTLTSFLRRAHFTTCAGGQPLHTVTMALVLKSPMISSILLPMHPALVGGLFAGLIRLAVLGPSSSSVGILIVLNFWQFCLLLKLLSTLSVIFLSKFLAIIPRLLFILPIWAVCARL